MLNINLKLLISCFYKFRISYLVSVLKYLFTFVLLPLLVFSQEITLVETSYLDAEKFIGIDFHDNTYYIKDQILFKKSNDSVFNFKDFQLGEIYSVDISNPLNIAVYYQDFNVVILLDNKLSEIERINFNAIYEFINTSQVSIAANTSLWAFNLDSQQLELYNYRNQNKTTVSQPLNGEVIQQVSNINYCFLMTEKYIRAYNIYGSLIIEIPNEGYQKISQINENLIAKKDNNLYYINKETQETSKIKSPEISIKDLQLTQEFLYIYDGNKVSKFKLTF